MAPQVQASGPKWKDESGAVWIKQPPTDPSPRSRSRERRGKGKGKGKGKVQNDKPTAHYFDLFPERAKGRKFIKCANPKCFGSCLEGDRMPDKCRFCQWSFKKRSSSEGSAAAKSDASISNAVASNSLAKKTFDNLVAKGYDVDEAVTFVKETLELPHWKPPITQT